MVATSQSAAGLACREGSRRAVHRALPEEVPVAMVYNGTTQAVMMATPAAVADFAFGFALTEGAIEAVSEIESFEEVAHPHGIEARLWLREDRAEALAARRRVMAGPVGCGLCGIDSLEEAARAVPRVVAEPRFSAGELCAAPEALRAHQSLHDQTRAVHAAGFLRPGAGIVMAREDVGRHNALDKLIGALARADIDPAEGGFVLTSRLSVELVQKAAMARCPLLLSVSAPTAYALRLAEEAGITLGAFARESGFELFSHSHRVSEEVPHVA